jgi:hypothetical protein
MSANNFPKYQNNHSHNTKLKKPLANAPNPFSSHSFSATANAKTNTIDNQPIIYQNT